MKEPAIKIGESKGIGWRKTLLKNNQHITNIILKPRKGWEKAFKKIAKNKEDKLLFDDVFEDENLEEITHNKIHGHFFIR